MILFMEEREVIGETIAIDRVKIIKNRCGDILLRDIKYHTR